MVGFVADIENHCNKQIKMIDIGGGLSTSFMDCQEPEEFKFSTYRQQLEEVAPELFSGKYTVITEFGGSLAIKAGKTLTRIESIKHWLPDVTPIILTHVGANQFIDAVYVPDEVILRFDVATPEGKLKKEGPKRVYDVGGCMCFQGDYLRKNLEIFEAEPGDYLIIHETGGYCMTSYSKFHSIIPSPVIGFSRNNNESKYNLICIKERETYEETLAFWGNENPRVIQGQLPRLWLDPPSQIS